MSSMAGVYKYFLLNGFVSRYVTNESSILWKCLYFAVIMIFLNMRGGIKSWCDRLTKITRKIRYFYRLLLCHFMEYDNEFLWEGNSTGEFFISNLWYFGNNYFEMLAIYCRSRILVSFSFLIYLRMHQHILNSLRHVAVTSILINRF